jgi:hypothetical protein
VQRRRSAALRHCRAPKRRKDLPPIMKTLTKVLETMLSKEATPAWTTDGPSLPPQIGPVHQWGWGP